MEFEELEDVDNKVKLGTRTFTNIANTFKYYTPFVNNFGEIIIIKDGGKFCIYNAGATEDSSYIDYTDSKAYIDGWMMGAIKANNHIINPNTTKTESVEEKTSFPKKIKSYDGFILTKVDDGTEENAGIPVYMNDKGDEVLVPDIEKYEIIEENEKKTEGYDNLSVGTKIYYTGDAANSECVFEIANIRPDGSYDLVNRTSGRQMNGVYPAQIGEAGNRLSRFWLNDEYKAWRKEQMEKLYSQYAKKNEGIVDNLSNSDKMKIIGIDKIISDLQSKFNVQVTGSYTDNSIILEIKGNVLSLIDAYDYLKNYLVTMEDKYTYKFSDKEDNKIICTITEI